MMSNKVPTFNRVHVKKAEAKQTSLIITNDRSLFEEGVVVAFGPLAGIRNEKRYHRFYPGQKVIYQKSQVLDVVSHLSDEKYLVLNDDAIIVADSEDYRPSEEELEGVS